MDTKIKKSVRNSELAVPKNKRVFLTYPANGLITCELDESDDSVVFIFDTHGLQPAETVLKKPMWEQLRFLYNCAELLSLNAEYDFSLSMDNLMIDINYMPKILLRDAKKSDSADFIQRYKALIGSILLPRYKYDDFLCGGKGNFKKNKLLNELSLLETETDIKERLYTEYRQLMNELTETKKLVPKKNALISRIAIPMLIIALAAAIFFGGRMFFMDIPFRDNVIDANTAYINSDFLSVQNALRSYNVSDLSFETRFILSRSYVSTEALSDIQRENILLGLAQRTDPIIFDYWILLGRLYFNEAIEIAQRLGDDELLLFAYLKHEMYARQDMSMPGDERAALISYLENNIDRLNRARDEAAESAIGNP